MSYFWQILFWLSSGSLLVAYLLYPLWVRLAARSRACPTPAPDPAQWPEVEIIFAAYNEEAVLGDKLANLLALDYPAEKLKLRVGSDHSSDGSNQILKSWQSREPRLAVHYFMQRQGKTGIINQLCAASSAEVLVLTDANILFDPSALKALVRALLADRQRAAVGGVIHYRGAAGAGISGQERDYLQWENKLKEAESRLWGFCLGLEGSCYALRRKDWPGIPPLYFMEDFYVSMALLAQGKKLHWEPQARVWEEVSISAQEEYKRKLRISIGNWQNFNHFKHLIISRFWPLGLAFVGHKLLRWLSPFMLILLLISATQLALYHWFYTLSAGLYMTFIGLGLFGLLYAQKGGGGWLKYPGHFIYMNLALLDGFFTYLKGVKSNAWQPTARKQDQ